MNEAFWPFFESKARVRVSYGGAGSSKSYSCFQDIIYKLVSEPGHNFLICRKVAVTSKTSTFALALQVINDMGLNKLFKINKSDLSITVKLTGYMAVFKGLDDIEKLKSITFPKGILTDVVVEEASEITQADFNQLNVRLRGKKPKGIRFQITLLLNPISDQHWIKREFLDLKSYQKSISVYLLHTTYLDNEFIDEDYRAVLEGYKDIDYEFYRVYCLGEWGTFGDIIFTNWKFAKCPYTENDFDSVYAGQDFGFKHPQVIVKVGFKDGKMYTFKELCVFEKTNKEIK
jgi:phage terminase large subunit